MAYLKCMDACLHLLRASAYNAYTFTATLDHVSLSFRHAYNTGCKEHATTLSGTRVCGLPEGQAVLR